MSTFPFREGEHYRVDENGCWLWLGYIDPLGYGRCQIMDLVRATHTARSHRMSWMLWNGVEQLPARVHIHHKCRTKACINPAHLDAKGIKSHIRHHRRTEDAILTVEDVEQIRIAAWNHTPLVQLAAKYGITVTTVGLICLGKKWPDTPGPIGRPPKQCEVCGGGIEPKPGSRKRIYCSKRCKTRRNYLSFTAGRKRRPSVEARWSKPADVSQNPAPDHVSTGADSRRQANLDDPTRRAA